MKVSGINPISNPMPKENTLAKTAKNQDMPAAVYEKDKAVNKVTYDRPANKLDKAAIDKLKAESQQAYRHLQSLVEALLKKQDKPYKGLRLEDFTEIDEETRLEAERLVSPEGPLGAEAVSNRIVEFAKAISGGDKTKLEELKSAIDKGFKEAEKVLGSLPEVSKQTHELIMDKLDAWAKEEDK